MGKKKRKGGSNKPEPKPTDPKFTAQDLMKKVEEYIDTFDYELALKFCEKAMEMEPGDVKIIETSACVYAEAGDIEKAKEYFLKAVNLNAEIGYEKYMYLGQMSEGDEAKKWYLKGIEIMKKELESANDSGENTSHLIGKGKVTKTDISNAFCALAEIFMTDCCFEDDAAAQCEKFCSEALEFDAKNCEAYIVNANFLLSLERKEEARNLLIQCFELLNIKPLKTEDNESENEEMEESPMGCKSSTVGATWNLGEENTGENLPPYASRVTLAKLLTETGDHDKAEIILNTLVDDDDEDFQVWYMYGWNYYLQDEFSEAIFYLEKAKEINEKLPCDDEEVMKHVDEMLETCKSKISSVSNGMEVEE